MHFRRLALALVLCLAGVAPGARAQFANTEVSGPGSGTPFRITKAQWSWEDLGGPTYSIYRSDRPDGGFACLLDLHPQATWTGDQDPQPATRTWHYLVTAYDGTDDNRPGARSDGTPRSLATPCPRDWACCLPDGTCAQLVAADCAAAGGTAQGTGSDCATVTCVLPEACCLPDGTCADLSAADCATAGGASQGAGTTCATTTCTPPCAAGTPVPGLVPVQLVRIGPNFASPIFLTSPPGDDRLFILERAGRIRIQFPDGTRTLFLDFSARVPSTSSERGALGLGFHPDYATNGKLYVHYSGAPTVTCGPGSCTTVSEFTVTADPNVADPASERILFQTSHSQGNHNGGWLGFGPDGMLYTSIGDGGEQGDPQNRAEDLSQYMGKILRIDVDGRDAGLEYAVPPDNPFVGVAGARAEIWSYGMRNPWRNAFDTANGDFYVADVGQNCYEEVSVLTAASGGGRGANLGWNTMEGTHCFNTARFGDCAFTGCTPVGVLPVHDYSHGDGCSVTGGYVYRGCLMPDYNGWYFFTDYCSGWLDAFNFEQGVPATYRRLLPGGSIGGGVSFGQDDAGEIYVLEGSGGVYRLEPQ